MNWKKTILFIFLILLGLVLFNPLLISFLSIGYILLFQPLFFVAYVVVLSLLFKKYSKKRLMIVIALFIIYLLIMIIPFSGCDHYGKPFSPSQECACLGIKKYSWGVFDASWSQCVGIPLVYQEDPPQILLP